MKNKCEDLIAAKEWYRIAKEQNNKLAIEILENKFPELKESEDEKIKKQIIGFITYSKILDETKKNWIAWLEKQGNLMKALQISNAKIGELIEENYYLKEQLEKQGDYNRLVKEIKECKELFSKEKKKAVSTNDKLSLGGRIAMLEELLAFTKEKQGEQKPSEEVNGEDYGIDGLYAAMDILNKTLGLVEGYQSDDGILEHKAAMTAVKKLYKQRPAAWNEEDERMYRGLHNLIYSTPYCDTRKEFSDWFKTLKERYTWKPSDKQLHYLSWIANVKLGDGIVEQEVSKHLNELLEDLKKLKE